MTFQRIAAWICTLIILLGGVFCFAQGIAGAAGLIAVGLLMFLLSIEVKQ